MKVAMSRTEPSLNNPAKPMPATRRLILWQTMAVAAVTLFVALMAAGIVRSAQEQRKSGPAPDFTLSLFGGGQITLSELRGQVVVINFWASWCDPCRDEAPFLERAWRKRKDQGVMFIGIDYLDSEKEALAYLKEFDITYPNGPDLASKIAQQYRIRGVPETFIVNPEGRIVFFKPGPMTEEELLAELAKLGH